MSRGRYPLAALLVAGCAGGEPREGGTFTIRDSSGIEIVESHAPQWLPGDAWRLSSEPITRIGADRGRPEYELWQVTNVRLLADGTVAVLNSGSNELRVYDSNGDYLRTYGKQGPGPGEFEHAWGLHVSGDTLMVLDWSGSVAFFHRVEGFIRELGRANVFTGPYSVDYLLPDGSAFARKLLPPDDASEGPYRPPFEIVLGTRGGESITFGVYGGILQERVGQGRERTSVVPPYAATTWYHIYVPDSLVAVGDNAEYAIRIFGFDGTLRRIVRRSVPLERVTDSDVETWKQVQRELDWTRGQLPQLERLWLEVSIPESKPAYGPFAFSREGHLWVGRAAIDGEPVLAYSVFDERGAWLGDVEVPRGLRHVFREVDIGDGYFSGVWVDESGLEEVRVYSIEEP